jgi:hypothetical protein
MESAIQDKDTTPGNGGGKDKAAVHKVKRPDVKK